ncbi:hypothetical protein GCM10010937_10090 [Gluconobacter japonicus]|uniref:Transposase n=1 Tax=Gluconobacter japonicus TaxID=376620 RepID=A0ABQ5WI41_GLUJA|nr:hypothetical protein AA3271_2176 [Gluconobacter japonicus NBRC 3271]GLQ59206.1 hypothetical protein GCM10010937_10090 [Gluconobacter japonicus]
MVWFCRVPEPSLKSLARRTHKRFTAYERLHINRASKYMLAACPNLKTCGLLPTVRKLIASAETSSRFDTIQ